MQFAKGKSLIRRSKSLYRNASKGNDPRINPNFCSGIAMRIVYSNRYESAYPANPVENPDSVRLPAGAEERGLRFPGARAAGMEDIPRVHGLEHIELVKTRGLYEAAALAAGGAIALPSWLCRGSQPSHWCARPAITLQPTGPGECATSTIWP